MAKKPDKKLLKFKTTYTLDGVTKTITYHRAQQQEHRKTEDELNLSVADAIAEYAAACQLGLAKDVKVEMEEVLV